METSPNLNQPTRDLRLYRKMPQKETYQYSSDIYYYIKTQSKATDHPNYPWNKSQKLSTYLHKIV